MSVQTLSDLMVSQQLKKPDLQLSEQNKFPLSNSDFSMEESKSFSDLVAMNKEVPKNEETVKNDSTETYKVTENEESEKVESFQEHNQDKTTAKSEKIETEKTAKKFSAETKDEKIEANKIDEKSEKKVSKKSFESQKKTESKEKNQKLSQEDFSRLNELTVVIENKTEAVDLKSKKQRENVEKIEFDSDFVSDKADLLQFEQNNVQIASDGDFSGDDAKNFNESLDFASKKEKVSSLDKEGKIKVEDFRTQKDVQEESIEPKLKTELKIENDNTATITMDFAQNVDADVLSLNNQTAASSGSTYQAMLNNQVQMNTPEFVKAGNIVLKDNNQGTINLVLHPDDLGNVKIQLSLDGKTLSGHITVATKEAMEVFKDNAQTLREAFIESGFDVSNFDVSYGGGNNNFAQSDGFNQRNDGTEILRNKVYANLSGYDDSDVNEFVNTPVNSDEFSINIVA